MNISKIKGKMETETEVNEKEKGEMGKPRVRRLRENLNKPCFRSKMLRF